MLKINGAEYPCQQTMGALRIFQTEVGHDIPADLGAMSTQDFFVYIYACCKSACRKTKHSFPYDCYDDFADALPLDGIKEILADFLAILTNGKAEKKEEGGTAAAPTKKNSRLRKPTE